MHPHTEPFSTDRISAVTQANGKAIHLRLIFLFEAGDSPSVEPIMSMSHQPSIIFIGRFMDHLEDSPMLKFVLAGSASPFK
jgi:hypothetical protein